MTLYINLEILTMTSFILGMMFSLGIIILTRLLTKTKSQLILKEYLRSKKYEEDVTLDDFAKNIYKK